MIAFQPIHPSDKGWIDKFILEEDSRSADSNFTNIYAWNNSYAQQAAELHGCLVLRAFANSQPYYTYPIGHGDTKAALLDMREDAAFHGSPLHLRGVLTDQREALDSLFPGAFSYSSDRYVYDYVYSAEKLATLAGKKLHGKRNHINRFIEEHPDWAIEPITPHNVAACLTFTKEWIESHEAGERAGFRSELTALQRVFDQYAQLGLDGILLKTGGETIGYTMGEKLNSDTFIVHFEKAFSHIQGAYPILNREFVRCILAKYPEIKYINREDDMGIENLRRAKESYQPVFLVEKYTAKWN